MKTVKSFTKRRAKKIIKNSLLTIAKADLKTAKLLVNSTDKYQKHQAAYMVQQAIEKTLKYLISQKTGGEPWGHDIYKLVLLAEKESVSVPQEIKNNAIMYTMWEAASRYYPTKIIRRDTISKAIRICDKWHKEIIL